HPHGVAGLLLGEEAADAAPGGDVLAGVAGHRQVVGIGRVGEPVDEDGLAEAADRPGPQPDLRIPAAPVDLAGGHRAPRDHGDAAGADVPLLPAVGEGRAEGAVVAVDGQAPAELALEVGDRLV